MSKRTRLKAPITGDHAQNRMAETIDQLAEFEEYRAMVLPKIRKLLAEGYKAADLYKVFKDDLEARKLTIALTEPDATKALAAVKDIQDRHEGRPVERKELSHKYSQLKDEELDALVMSELDEVDEAALEAAALSGSIPPLSDTEN